MKTYLFDFDGTLVDSMPYYGRAMLQVLVDHGITPPDGLLRVITPLGYQGTAAYFRAHFDLPEGEKALMKDMAARLIPDYLNVIPAKDGVREALLALKERGDSLNVLTASPHLTLDPCLKRNGLFDLFDNVWSCEDFGTTKSDPDIYRQAAERLGRTVGECVFLDDNINAVSTAIKAGMISIGVFDESSRDDAEAMRTAADGYITRMTELLRRD